MRLVIPHCLRTAGQVLAVGLLLHSACAQQQPAVQQSKLQPPYGQVRFSSSDQRLVDGYNWAKTQALAYIFTGDPVGNWYEAALPDRSAFCMRDVSHQSIGAQVLGLAEFNRNMLRKFAGSIAESRGWAAYWEIDKFDEPAPVDYKNDREFWFNLPANFDVLNTCYQAYQWTGDDTYLNDSVFLNFYRRTLRDYIRKWDKDGTGTPESYPEYGHRGIASYNEDSHLHIKVGGDLVAAEFAAYLASSAISQLRGDLTESIRSKQKAKVLRQRFEETWWNAKWGVFYSALLTDGRMYFDSSSALFPLWFGLIAPGPKLEQELDMLMRLTVPSANRDEQYGRHDQQLQFQDLESHLRLPGVEEMSYIPEIAYRYGRNDSAYSALLSLTDPELKRREYPEVSFSVIRTIAVGLMGIAPDASKRTIKTVSHLTKETEWADLENVPVFGNLITVSHLGLEQTTLRNQSGAPIQWQAAFPGSFTTLILDDRAVKARLKQNAAAAPESFIIVNLEPGQQKTVRSRPAIRSGSNTVK